MEQMSEECKKAFMEFMKAQLHEIDVHKWIESEKAGHDLGDTAVRDWIDNHAAQFRKEWEEAHKEIK